MPLLCHNFIWLSSCFGRFWLYMPLKNFLHICHNFIWLRFFSWFPRQFLPKKRRYSAHDIAYLRNDRVDGEYLHFAERASGAIWGLEKIRQKNNRRRYNISEVSNVIHEPRWKREKEAYAQFQGAWWQIPKAYAFVVHGQLAWLWALVSHEASLHDFSRGLEHGGNDSRFRRSSHRKYPHGRFHRTDLSCGLWLYFW